MKIGFWNPVYRLMRSSFGDLGLPAVWSDFGWLIGYEDSPTMTTYTYKRWM